NVPLLQFCANDDIVNNPSNQSIQSLQMPIPKKGHNAFMTVVPWFLNGRVRPQVFINQKVKMYGRTYLQITRNPQLKTQINHLVYPAAFEGHAVHPVLI
ncbi:MAG: hypothetical protein ACOCV9_05695, partial [Marinilabiliaceae bacterium]